MHVPKGRNQKNGQEAIVGPAFFIPLLIIATVSRHVFPSCDVSRAVVWFNVFWRRISVCQVGLKKKISLYFSDPCRMHHNSLSIICVYDAQTQKAQTMAPPSACPSGPEQLCASDGKTYNSECQMQRTALQKDRQLKQVHSGPCKKQGESQSTGFTVRAAFENTAHGSAGFIFSQLWRGAGFGQIKLG